MSDERHEAISRRAYTLWQEEGGEHGRHDDHWHRAAREVEDGVTVTAPDGTTMPIPTAAEVLGDAPLEPAMPAATPAEAAKRPRAARAATEVPARTPAKPRKPKAK